MTVAEEIEARALAVRTDRKALRKELNEARSCLRSDLRKQFAGARFDFENARLVTQDGTLSLQWLLRRRPNAPVSYENQQTSQGIVVCRSFSEGAG